MASQSGWVGGHSPFNHSTNMNVPKKPKTLIIGFEEIPLNDSMVEYANNGSHKSKKWMEISTEHALVLQEQQKGLASHNLQSE